MSTPSAAPAGWYPDTNPDLERYWDGTAWTEQVRSQPGSTTAATVIEPPVAADAPAKKKFKMPLWGWIVIGVVVLIVLISSIANAGGKDEPTPAAAPTESVAARETPTAAAVATTVPDVVGITAKEARALIENAKLVLQYQADKGVVLDQDNWTVTGTTPAAGTAVNEGDTIVVQVTKTVKEAAAPSTPAAPAQPEATLEQQQALQSARSYLDYSGFSRQGLIDQLSSQYGEGFPVEVATWAADNAGADWNAEAAESAQSYLDMGGYSKQSLYDQLTSQYGEQFTPDQANYALTKVGY